MLNKLLLLLAFLFTLTANIHAENRTNIQSDGITIDGNQYRRYVKSVDYSYEMKGIVVHLTLSDDTQWIARFYYERSDDLDKVEKLLAIGTEIFLRSNFGRRILVDSQLCDSPYDLLSFYQKIYTSHSFPQVIKIEERRLEGSWFYKKEYYLFLSDNSIWKTTSKIPFNIGDHILVSLTKNNDEWCLSRKSVYEGPFLFTPINVVLTPKE
ncbi:MAG: hypothetical protein WC222_06870 [Parachlamydiales bacterium]|jgi:hypothetical protein